MNALRTLLVGALALSVVVLAALLLRGPDEASPAATPQVGMPVPDAIPGESALQPPQAPELQVRDGSSSAERQEVSDRLGDLTLLVLDAATQRPLPAVPVTLGIEGDAEPLGRTSGDDGRCRFEALEPGAYTLSTLADGDLDYVCEPLELELAEGARPEVELRVERRWFLAGVVVEKGSGRPAAGVRLAARDATDRASALATSDEEGRFRSRRSYPAGPAVVFVSADETEGLMRTHDVGPELLAVVVGQEDVSHLTVELVWTGVVRGVVVDGRDRPIAGAALRLLGGDSIYLSNATLRPWGLYASFEGRGRTQRSDDQGRFVFEHLPSDRKLVVVASAPGFAIGRSPDLSPPFRSDDEEVVVRLVEGGAIAGQVLDAGGEPLGEAIVFALCSATDFQPDPTSTDAQGAFRLEGLMPGPAEVTAQVRGGNRLPYAVASAQVEVLAGQELRLVLQAGADGVHLRGIAVDQNGRRITPDRLPLSVRATPLAPQPGETTWGHDTPLAPDGSFDVTVAREATYRLTLLSRTAGDAWENLEVQAPADDLQLTFTLRPSGILRVRALDAETDEPVGEGHYALRWERGSMSGNFFGGEVHTIVQQGRYDLTVSAEGHLPTTRQLDLSGALPPETLVELRLERGRSVAGRVVDGAGQPIKGCAVVLRVDGQLDTDNLVYTDVEGRFTLPSAPLEGGEACVIDDSYRTLASAPIGAGEVLLTVEEP